MDDFELREILDSELTNSEKLKKLDELCPNIYQEGKTKPEDKRNEKALELIRLKCKAFAGM